MTNNQIIMEERVRLFNEGKIGTTGRMLSYVDGEGKTVFFPEPEEIHTFASWKAQGFKVKKGSKAIATFTIWKYATKEVENDDGETEERSRMFMKKSSFFARSQVEPMVVEERMVA